MSLLDKGKAEAENLKGKAKEAFGSMTGDSETEAEGNLDQAKSAAKKVVNDVKDKAKETFGD